MKLKLLTIAVGLACIPAITFSQQISNGDMEDWEPLTLGAGEKPVGWDTPDVIAAALGVTDRVVEKDVEIVHGGTASAKLTTKELTTPITGTLTVPGIVALGTIIFDPIALTAYVGGGVEMTEAPTGLKGFYTYSPAAGDTAKINVVMKKAGAIIGGGEFVDPVGVGAFTMFNIDIAYFTADLPDTMQIVVSSSGGFTSSVPGSILHVDDMELTGLTAINNLPAGLHADIYPNPARTEINIQNPFDYAVSLELYNMNGEKINSLFMHSDMNTISTVDLPSGIYVFRMMDNGMLVYSDEFMVAH